MESSDALLFARRGFAGHITLNRPEALNAVSHDMVRRIDGQLRIWSADPDISVVTVAGAGGRAFAAGGDIRDLHAKGRRAPESCWPFFRDEYRLNVRIKRFPKPYIAFMDGIVMGGGVGLSVHGAVRVAGPGTLFAMPETGIGLFPDVGGSYFLPRLPGATGMFLGLVGARLNAADCVAAGVADLHVPRERQDEARAVLEEMRPEPNRGAAVKEALRRLSGCASDPGPAQLTSMRANLDQAFGAESLAEMYRRLQADGTGWADRQLAELAKKSPTSLALAWRQLRAGAALSFEECMRMEYRLARHCMAGHDFYEGVRAAILDKDGRPRWIPPSLDQVAPEAIDQAFAALPADEELRFE